LLEAAVGTLEVFAIHLGRKLGLYGALDAAGSLTESELARTAGISERYAREWLEQQAVAGYVTVTVDAADPAERAYGLTEEQKAVLVRAEDPAHVSPLASMAAGIGLILDRITDAYRSGAGVPYARYGGDFRHGQGAINRPAFTHDLTGSWIPAVPGVHRKLSQGSSRVADLGCGQGWAALAVAAAYPEAEVVGIDADAASIEEAKGYAGERGVDVSFVRADADSVADHGPFDLVLILETLHDLARPVRVLRAVRSALAPAGVVLVADELVADSFTAPGDLLERMMYGWSITHCLPSQLVEKPSAAIGTVIRAGKVLELATEAGFGTCEIVDVDGGFFRLYRLED
jgi:2-polyprenyl-3-methyl-5-hydroxy-6-metoxy-1,4-benzoquinol methylase